jgi:putative tryptophan/tyrosine transport system substrate-binding protein
VSRSEKTPDNRRLANLRAAVRFLQIVRTATIDLHPHPPHHPGMDRRRFLLTSLGGVLAAPLATEAQPAGRVPRIGYLGTRTLSDFGLDAFRQGLRDLGWVEGQNIGIDYRFAEGRLDRVPDAAELVRLKVDIIVAHSTPGAAAARNATETIPIVMISVGDPVGLGLIASLAHPGGNATGLSFGVGSLEIIGKQLGLLKETVPKFRGWRSSQTRAIRWARSRLKT